MKKIVLSALFLILGSAAMAQKTIQFESKTHNFGEVKEEGGKVRHTFTFENAGQSPIKITKVRPSCGCTTPRWSKEEVKPGDDGLVVAEFNPKGRPHKFRKTMTVHYEENGQQKTEVLTIKGDVKPKPKTLSDEYPDKFGGQFRMKSRYMNMGIADPTMPPLQKKFRFYNTAEEPVTIEKVSSRNPNISFSVAPKTIGKKEHANISVTYNAKAIGKWGYQNDPVTIEFANHKPLKNKVHVVGTIQMQPKKDLSKEEKATAPKMSFDTREYNFGTIEEGEVVKTDFTFTNTGNGPLEVYKTKSSCGCTASNLKKKKFAKNEGGSITVTFNSRGKHPGSQHQTVTLYTNDPRKPTQRITIKGKVKKNKSGE